MLTDRRHPFGRRLHGRCSLDLEVFVEKGVEGDGLGLLALCGPLGRLSRFRGIISSLGLDNGVQSHLAGLVERQLVCAAQPQASRARRSRCPVPGVIDQFAVRALSSCDQSILLAVVPDPGQVAPLPTARSKAKSVCLRFRGHPAIPFGLLGPA